MSEWRPIETAPKSGIVVDLWCRSFSGQAVRLVDMWWSATTGWRGAVRSEWREEVAKMATHWQPLPEPPK